MKRQRRSTPGQQANSGLAAGLLTGNPTVNGRIPLGMEHRLAPASLALCQYLRLPAPGQRCVLSSLSRTSLVELGDAGLIRLVRVRKPGTTRGCVLVDKASLLEYLTKLGDEQQGKGTGAEVRP